MREVKIGKRAENDRADWRPSCAGAQGPREAGTMEVVQGVQLRNKRGRQQRLWAMDPDVYRKGNKDTEREWLRM